MTKLLSLTSCISVFVFMLSCPQRDAHNQSGKPCDSTQTLVVLDSLTKDTIQTIRVEHGSSDQMKLDSIKDAKGKLKKKRGTNQ